MLCGEGLRGEKYERLVAFEVRLGLAAGADLDVGAVAGDRPPVIALEHEVVLVGLIADGVLRQRHALVPIVKAIVDRHARRRPRSLGRLDERIARAPARWAAVGDEHGERGKLLRLRERYAPHAALTPGRLDLLAGRGNEPKPLRLDRLIERHLLGRDPLKRLPLAQHDGLQQHAALGVDLQPVTVSAATELVQLKRVSAVSPIRQPPNRIGSDRFAPRHACPSGWAEPQGAEQRRRIKEQRDLLTVAVPQRQVPFIAVRTVAPIPRPPGVAVADQVGAVARAALMLLADTTLSPPDAEHLLDL